MNFYNFGRSTFKRKVYLNCACKHVHNHIIYEEPLPLLGSEFSTAECPIQKKPRRRESSYIFCSVKLFFLILYPHWLYVNGNDLEASVASLLRNSHTKCMDIARRKRTDGYRWLLSRDCNHWNGFFYHNKQTYWQQKELFWAFESIENTVLMEVQGLPRSAPQITHRCIPAEKEMTHKPC